METTAVTSTKATNSAEKERKAKKTKVGNNQMTHKNVKPLTTSTNKYVSSHLRSISI